MKTKKNVLRTTLSLVMCASLSMNLVLAGATGLVAEDAAPETESATPEVTVTVTVEENGNETTTTTEKTWSDETGGTDEETSTETTTVTEGSETTTETETTDSQGRVIQEVGQVEGSETTVTKTETTDVTTTEDVVINGDGQGETTQAPTETTTEDGDAVETPVNPDNDGWTEGKTETTQDWTENQEKSSEGQFETTGTTQKPNESTDADITEPEGSVQLDLKPGKTDTETVYIGLDDVANAETAPQEVTDEPFTDEDGRSGTQTITVTPKYENNQLVGYDVTTTRTYETETTADKVEGDTTESKGQTVTTRTAPTGYTEGTVEAEGENGEKIVTRTEPIYETNEAGEQVIIGYTITKTTTSTSQNTNTVDSETETNTENAAPISLFALPEKPAESERTDETTGETTRTTVEEIVEDGKVVGYQAITVKTDKDGKELSRSSSSVYGTTTTVNKTTVTDPTREETTTDTTTTITEVTTVYGTTYTQDVTLTTDRTTIQETDRVIEKDSYELVGVGDKLYFVYKGTMTQVRAVEDNGVVALVPVKPTVQANSSNGLDPVTDISNPPKLLVDPGSPDESQFKYVAYGLISEYRAKKSDGANTSEVHQYKLIDENGNEFYAYCADLNTTAYRNTLYEIHNIQDETYYQGGSDAVEHIGAIAQSGYWGTSSGMGSLNAVKALLKDEANIAYLKSKGFTDKQISAASKNLNDGEAMTATQAAIWHYGNTNAANGSISATRDQATTNISVLYELLISDHFKNRTTVQETDIIDQKDILEAGIVLHNKVVEQTEKEEVVVTDGKGHDLYNADVGFTLAVDKSSVNGDLVVHVIQNGKVITTKRLAGDDSSTQYGQITPDKNGHYTIPNIQIAEGVNITLNLEGTQDLEKGVYIYTAASGSHLDSQSFVGVAEGSREVNLEVDLKFTVEEPDADLKKSGSTTSQKKTDKTVETRTEQRSDTKVTTTTDTDRETRVDKSSTTRIYADVTVTEITNTETQSLREWFEQWKNTYDYPSGGGRNPGPDPTPDPDPTPEIPEIPETPDEPVEIPDEDVPLSELPEVPLTELPEVPLTELPEEPTPLVELPEDPVPLAEIPDEDVPLTELPEDPVPLADIPATGDPSLVLMALTVLSGAGLVGLNRMGKKEED